jgi:UDP-N-acetylglucosamine--N-acetylmuramyl-(pentapeptide) pyrophosphoryl-undecaprenol N-acetylglucosamine transferase
MGCWMVGRYVDTMEMMYASADVVVARAGAITCSELLVTATPAILV